MKKLSIFALVVLYMILMPDYPSLAREILANRVVEKCVASIYTVETNGTVTASGVPFNNNKYTAAHKTLPFGSRIRVRNLSNDRTVTVTITDRGPFIAGRCIDLSRSAAATIGLTFKQGLARVTIEKEN